MINRIKIKNFFKRLKEDEIFRNKVGLYGGAMLSLAFVAMQLYGGIAYQSVWFTSLAVYYAVLSGVRFYLGRSIGKKGKAGWKIFRIAGITMTILNLALVVMISMMITNPGIALHKYSLAIAIATAVWTLVSAMITIASLVKLRGRNAPVVLAAKLVQMTASVVAILMLQTAMVASISTLQIKEVTEAIEGVGSETAVLEWASEWASEIFRALATSNSATGVLVAVFVIGVTIYMIVRGVIEERRR